MRKRMRKILGIVITALAVLTAAALIASAVGIYRTGSLSLKENGASSSGPYSQETIGARFRVIAPVIYTFLAAAGLGLISRAFFSEEHRPASPQRTDKQTPHRPKTVRVLRLVIFIAATVLIVLGIVNGGMRDVFVKAKMICMECIGLG